MKSYTGLSAVRRIFNLATAANDFLVASGAGVFVKKTLAQTKAILGVGVTVYEIKLADDGDKVAVSTKKEIGIPIEKTGMNLINAQAILVAPSDVVVSYQISNETDAVNMLTTQITIDIGEYSSYTAAIPSVIDVTKDDVVTADRIGITKTNAGTTETGDMVILTFSPP